LTNPKVAKYRVLKPHEMACIWVLVLLGVFFLQGRDPTLSARFCNSTTDMMVHGEWWRPFTALFLHRDMDHLLGKVLDTRSRQSAFWRI